MPTYSFRNIQTGVVEDKIMSMSSREEYLKTNPNLETIITGAPGLVKGTGDRTKNSSGFNEVLSNTDGARCKVIKVECFEHGKNSSIFEAE